MDIGVLVSPALWTHSLLQPGHWNCFCPDTAQISVLIEKNYVCLMMQIKVEWTLLMVSIHRRLYEILCSTIFLHVALTLSRKTENMLQSQLTLQLGWVHVVTRLSIRLEKVIIPNVFMSPKWIKNCFFLLWKIFKTIFFSNFYIRYEVKTSWLNK